MKICVFLCRRLKISQDFGSKRTDRFEAIFMWYYIHSFTLYWHYVIATTVVVPEVLTLT
jgi:hypothetical protein